MTTIDIESLIPHRGRIKLISEALEIHADSAVTAATVGPEWPLCDGKAINSLILVEAVAQTAALMEGHKKKGEEKSGAKGWLVGIKNADFKVQTVPVGTRLTVNVKNLYSFDNYGVVEGTVKADEEILAIMVLQALRFDEDSESRV
jgi:predicted hotdog family 3-hydroxylacyl-ACP dehydratase